MRLGARILGQFARPHGPLAGLFASWMNVGNRALNDGVLAELGRIEGNAVLEVGFGGGATLGRLLGAGGVGHAAGLDASPELVARARARYRRDIGAGRLDVRLGSAESLPWAKGCFDGALSVNSLFYWPDPDAGLRELHRVLRPGGRVAIGLRGPETIARLGPLGASLHAPGAQELERSLAAVGFDAVRVARFAGGLAGDFLVATARRPGS